MFLVRAQRQEWEWIISPLTFSTNDYYRVLVFPTHYQCEGLPGVHPVPSYPFHGCVRPQSSSVRPLCPTRERPSIKKTAALAIFLMQARATEV